MNINIGPDLPIGCGSRTDRLEHRYRTTCPLLTYLKPWGEEFVLVIQDGNILGMVRRDTRPVWQKIRERTRRYLNQRFPGKEVADERQAPQSPGRLVCLTIYSEMQVSLPAEIAVNRSR